MMVVMSSADRMSMLMFVRCMLLKWLMLICEYIIPSNWSIRIGEYTSSRYAPLIIISFITAPMIRISTRFARATAIAVTFVGL